MPTDPLDQLRLGRSPFAPRAEFARTLEDALRGRLGLTDPNPERDSAMELTAIRTASISVGLAYRDAPAAIEWLSEVLGFRLVSLFQGDDGRVHSSHLVWRTGYVRVTTRDPEGTGLAGIGPTSLELAPEDDHEVDDMYRRVQATDAEVMVPLQATFYGSYGFTVRDPEGNLWNIGKRWLDSEEARNLPDRRL